MGSLSEMRSVSSLRKALMAATVVGFGLVPTGPATAGNIFLTGHDTDFHMEWGSTSATTALTAELAYVRAGSSLPVLVFDSNAGGSFQLSGDLTRLGVSYTLVDPATTAITDAMFSHSTYSAIAVASESSCGGCDMTPADNALIAAHVSAIGAFVTAGGGILGLAGATDPLAYAYVPTAASNGGGNPPSDGFVETAAGLAAGLVAENGDPTHNYFNTPGTGGLSSAFSVAEVNGDNVESIFVSGASIGCTGADCTITSGVPEPSTWAMMILGFAGIGFAGYRRRQKQRAALLAA